MSRNLVLRILVAIISIPIILWICYRGGWYLWGMVVFFSSIGLWEFLNGEKIKPFSLLYWLSILLLATVLTVMAYVTVIDLELNSNFPLLLVIPLAYVGLYLLSGILLASGKESPDKLFVKHARFIWGNFYITALWPFILLIGMVGTKHGLPGNGELSYLSGDLLLFLFALLWLGDTCAMFVGGAIGKRKLAPSVSPNKTIEGFIGGLAGAAIIGLILGLWKFPTLGWYHLVLLALGCSFFGQLGDLVESMWKRSVGRKDSSSLIPGHGGMLDRFDSLLFAAPFMYFYLLMLSLQ